jgi:hypothetical protein
MEIRPRSKFGTTFGNAWSPWPSDVKGNPNLVSNHRTLGHAILSFCLIQPGELFYTPEFGISPRLFDSMSSNTVRYFIVNLQNELIKWFEGYISNLSVEFEGNVDMTNQIQIKIVYTPKKSEQSHVISYPYFIYSGVDWTSYENMSNFLKDIRLDNQIILFPELI